jgi:transposase
MQSTILNRAWRRHAHIVFIDEAGFMLAPTLRCTWARRGCTPILRVADPHGRISVIGAISISPSYRRFCFYFHLLADNANFRGPSLVAFLDDLRRKIPGPITLLWDEIPIHRARAVRRFLHKHRKIVVEEFPPCSPELNPVDNVWGYVKYSRLGNYAPLNLDVLRHKVTAEFRRLRKRPDLLRSFYKHTGLSLAPVELSENGTPAVSRNHLLHRKNRSATKKHCGYVKWTTSKRAVGLLA